MNDILTLFNKIKFWQLTFLIAVILLGLGFTGSSIMFDMQVLDGKENAAIWGGFGTLFMSIVLRFIPAPERRIEERDKAAVTPTQAALAAKITEWTLLNDAANTHTPDYKLPQAELKKKATELRLKLGVAQGILRRRTNSDGKMEIRYRYDRFRSGS